MVKLIAFLYIFHVMLPCQNSETQIFCLDFRWPGILGVRISETQMFFRNLLLPTFWVSEFRKPKCFRPKFPFSVILSQLSIAKILGVRISETRMCFRNFLLPVFWVSEFRKPKYFRPKFPFSVILSQLSIAKILGVRISETQMCFRNFLLPVFWVSEFRKPKFQTKPLVMLCCYYHIPHKMRQTVEIRISSTVSRNFGRIVRKSKKFHTNNPNIVKTCRN